MHIKFQYIASLTSTPSLGIKIVSFFSIYILYCIQCCVFESIEYFERNEKCAFSPLSLLEISYLLRPKFFIHLLGPNAGIEILTHYHISRHQKYIAVENIVRKVEIACNKNFLLFSQCFLQYMIIIFHFKCTLKCR